MQIIHHAQASTFVIYSKNSWIADSGATNHFCNNLELLTNYVHDPLLVDTGNGTIISPGRGDVYISFRCSDGTYRPVCLQNVRYSPTSRLNTVSKWLLEQKQVYWRGELNQFVHVPSGVELFVVQHPNGLKLIDIRPVSVAQHNALVVPSAPLNLDTLHRRLAHLSLDGMREYLKQHRLELPDGAPIQPCEGCSLAKSTRQICRVSHTRATTPFQKVHLDTIGPLTIVGLGNYRYYLILTDDYTRYCWVSILLSKGQGFDIIEMFFATVCTQFSLPIAELHYDNDNEYGGVRLREFLDRQGSLLIHSTLYHHEQNGIAEWANGVIIVRARAMLLDAHLPGHLWPSAILALVYLTNRLPTGVNPGHILPVQHLHEATHRSYVSNTKHL